MKFQQSNVDSNVDGLHRTMCRGKDRRAPVATKDNQGASTILVPLSDGSNAVLNDRDFFRLMDVGLTDQWLINGNGRGTSYVRCRYHGQLVTVARLITDAPANSNVRILNGDHLDLRRRNLKVIQRKPRGTTLQWVVLPMKCCLI
jgi:hypothetical protein